MIGAHYITILELIITISLVIILVFHFKSFNKCNLKAKPFNIEFYSNIAILLVFAISMVNYININGPESMVYLPIFFGLFILAIVFSGISFLIGYFKHKK